MTPKRRIVVLAVVPMLLITSALIVSGIRVRVMGFFRGEPFFDGLPASAWSQDLENDERSAGQKRAFERLKKGGKEALPVLMEIAFHDNVPGRSQAQQLLVQQGPSAVPILVKALSKSSARDRTQAAVLLGDMGSKAEPAVESLARLLDDGNEEIRRAAMTAIEKIGVEAGAAVPDLIVILEGKGEAKSPEWLAQAARCLGQIGPPARKAVPVLAACLKRADKQLVEDACQALARMETEAVPAIPALMEVVQDRQSPTRARAAFALGKIGPAAKVAVPALIDALADTKNAALRDNSRDALGKMGPAASAAVSALVATFGRGAPITEIGPAAIPWLVELLGSSNEAVQADAKFFLEAFRKKAAQSAARAALLEALEEDENPAVRRAAAALLGPDWGEPRQIVPALLDALQHDETLVREAARETIIRFGSAAPPYLEQHLRGKNDALRLEVTQLFGRLGLKAQGSASLLVDVLKDDKDESPALRRAVARALAQMDYHPKEALPVLTEALKAGDLTIATLELVAGHGRAAAKDAAAHICTVLLQGPDWQVRRQAIFALGRIGVDRETSLPALRTALTDQHEMVRAAAAQVLGGSGFDPHEIAPLLTKLLEEPSRQVQGAALLGLAKLGKEAKAAAPLIHKLARATEKTSEDKDEPDLRVRCITALGAIGPSAREAVPLLLSWLQTAKSENVRGEIIEALGQMEVKEAVKFLEPLVQKEKAGEAARAALALWRINKSPAALAFLQEGLKEMGRRASFIAAIGRVGPPAQAAVPALIDILVRDNDLNHRALAAEALGRIGVNARPAIKALAESLKLPHHGLRIQAARALGQFEDDAAIAVPRLVDLLGDPQSPQVREAAADALRLIDADAADSAGV